MFEYVADLQLKPAKPYLKRSKTNFIVLHHFASDAAIPAVHIDHINNRGYRGIAYNIIVQLDGQAVWGRGLEYVGGHIKDPLNGESIGIAAQGNFDRREMSAAQRNTLRRVILDVLAAYPYITKIYGHKDLKAVYPKQTATACPGQYYPLDDMKALIDLQGTGGISVNDEPPAPGKWTQSAGLWYYTDEHGQPVKSAWVKHKGIDYYLMGNGAMAVNAAILDNAAQTVYTVNANGEYTDKYNVVK